MTDLAQQSVLVTGANRGLGRELVTQLLERDVARVYAGARDPGAVDASDARVVPVRLDVTDPASIAAAAASATDVGIVVNNAGISLAGSVLDADVLRRELAVNLFGALDVTAAFRSGVVERSGAVVNIASALSWIALGGTYSVAKAALWAASDSLRLELGPSGVQVVGVHMGYVDTDMAAGVDAPKVAAADVVRQVLDGLEAGATEVLADDTARQVRSSLHLTVEERYAPFTAAPAGTDG